MYEDCTTYKGNNGSREWFGYKLGLKENIYEQFAYFYNLVGYLGSSDITELGVIGGDGFKNIERQNKLWWYNND